MSGLGRSGAASTVRPPRAPWIVTALALLYSVAVAAGSTLAVWLARDDLPVQIVVHWGADGRPNRVAGLAEVMATNAVLTLGMALFLLGLGVAVRQERFMAAFSAGTSTFLAVVLAGSALLQRGATDSAEAGVTGVIWLGIAGGLVVGAAAWLIVRRRPGDLAAASGPLPEGARTLRVPSTARVAWTGHTRVTGWVWPLAAVGIVPMLVMGAVFAVNGSWADALLMLCIGLAVGLLVLAGTYSSVTIDARGVRVRGAAVVSWVNVPLGNVRGASVTTVDPWGSFGGYGKRVSFDAALEGMVTSKGEAILIERAGERPMVVTIDDAHRAAATLNTLLLRRSSS